MTNKEAIKLLNAHVDKVFKAQYMSADLMRAFDLAISALRAQTWVDVKELPITDGWYLVSVPWHSEPTKARFGEGKFWQAGNYYDEETDGVTHWTWLPAPPERGGSE